MALIPMTQNTPPLARCQRSGGKQQRRPSDFLRSFGHVGVLPLLSKRDDYMPTELVVETNVTTSSGCMRRLTYGDT